jgi:hypothetical protein
MNNAFDPIPLTIDINRLSWPFWTTFVKVLCRQACRRLILHLRNSLKPCMKKVII